MKKYQSLYLLAFALLLSGCVSSKAYRTTKAELLGYQSVYQSMLTRVDSLQSALGEMERPVVVANDDRMAELENLLAQREAALFEINQTIEDALSGFNGRGLSVTRRDGRIYVSMDEKLLFASGKAELSSEGEQAVRQLSQVLANNLNIDITVEGHTDNTGYIAKPDAQIVDNWDLSCKRATEVVRVMLKNSNIKPGRIIASGRAQYVPLATGNSPKARAQNRRTEIILTPQLDQLWQLLNKQTQ